MFPRSAETWLHKLASCLNPSWITHQPPHTDMGKNVMHDSRGSFNCALARRGDWSWLRWKLGERYKIFMAHKELLSGPGRNIKVTDFMFTLNQIEWLAKFLLLKSLLYFCPINISTATQSSLQHWPQLLISFRAWNRSNTTICLHPMGHKDTVTCSQSQVSNHCLSD